MTRREIFSMAASAPPWVSAANMYAQKRGSSKRGGTPSVFSPRAQGGGAAAPLDIVEHCRKIGLDGVRTLLQAVELEMAGKLGKRVRAAGIELILDAPPLPVEEGQLYRFDFALGACKAAGVGCLHAALADRSYEQFDSVAAFQRSFERLKNNAALAVPALEKNRIRLAIENHGDWRAAEFADSPDRLGCEYVGVCFGFGDSMALCEDPMDTLRTLARTYSCAISRSLATRVEADCRLAWLRENVT